MEEFRVGMVRHSEEPGRHQRHAQGLYLSRKDVTGRATGSGRVPPRNLIHVVRVCAAQRNAENGMQKRSVSSTGGFGRGATEGGLVTAPTHRRKSKQ